MLQFIFRATGSLLGCLIVTVAFAGDNGVGVSPGSLPAEGLSPIGSIYAPIAPIPEGPTPAVGPINPPPANIAAPGSITEPGSVTELVPPSASCGIEVPACGQPIMDCTGSCGHGHCRYGHCGHGHCGNCHDCCLRRMHYYCHFHTTGDMYPHFPYYPEHHGYYYFRPYNYTNVLKHRVQGLQLGVNPGNPYSVSMLDPLFDQVALTNMGHDDDYDMLPLQGTSLPDLEEVLKARK